MSLSTGHDTSRDTGLARTEVPAEDLVTLTIDGIEVQAPKGALLIRVAEELGIAIPRFCDHPLLEPAGACRQCLVEVAVPDREGNVRPMPKPQASCTMTVSPGMVVSTQNTSAVADKAQHGVMELLLVNHPLDCPICDKGGECPLQNQAMSNGRGTSRFVDVKRTFAKPIKVSTQVLLDRERCILCQRCTRFSKEIAGDTFIDLQKRGAAQQIGTFDQQVLGFAGERLTEGAAELDEAGAPFASYFSGNTIQICPVGALTGAAYRFRARPFDLVSSPTVCEHCSSGCAVRADHRRGVVLRRLAGEDPAVNEEWNCDKGRWAFTYPTLGDRLEAPMVRDEATGELVETSWPDALDVAARGLAAARDAAGVGTLVGGRATVEDAYAYAKFARVVLGTNDVDMRARPHSAEEEAFLASRVAGTGIGVTYADLERARAVVLVGFEPEEESPIVFLRLRKAVRAGGLTVTSLAPFATRGLEKLSGVLVECVPGAEAGLLRSAASSTAADPVATALRLDGAVLLVGERLAQVPGGLSAAAAAAEATGARLAWVPRRAGERGAVEAGALPNVLPGGRPLDKAALVDVAAAWGVDRLPSKKGRDTAGILAAAAKGAGLLVGGVDPDDLPDPAAARAALERASFVVSLEVRRSAVTELADVVLPVAPVAEKAGSFLDWEGRLRPFEAVLPSGAVADHGVLDELAEAMGVTLGAAKALQLRDELSQVGAWDGSRTTVPDVAPGAAAVPTVGRAVLATWHLLLDAGRLQDGEAYLAGTAHRAHARVSAATAEAHGLRAGGTVAVSGPAGTVTLPVVVDRTMVDGVVWLPTRSRGSEVRRQVGSGAGDLVGIAAGPDQIATTGAQA
ncbi:NADH-quinone oxidoreductase subunit G [Aquipuribacter nitratireducens]|uniref:NADH-quinone oxidoreductase subunit G n=1 Tax=Aquipuribacter nitratireducens TaxID=650104 RepID=A0ABW0GMC7_9MICO